MEKQNVVDFNQFKNTKVQGAQARVYELYVQSLSNSQLEVEVNNLLNIFSEDNYGDDYFTKGKLILKEISNRTHHQVRPKLEEMNAEVLKLL
ncbi:MAG: hypothetical protein WCY48_05250 [Candidatus Caldatribacteriota bacterium]